VRPDRLSVFCSVSDFAAHAARATLETVRVRDEVHRLTRVYDSGGRLLLEVSDAELAACAKPNIVAESVPADAPPGRRAIALGGIPTEERNDG
jgi:hypothetical protein